LREVERCLREAAKVDLCEDSKEDLEGIESSTQPYCDHCPEVANIRTITISIATRLNVNDISCYRPVSQLRDESPTKGRRPTPGMRMSVDKSLNREEQGIPAPSL